MLLLGRRDGPLVQLAGQLRASGLPEADAQSATILVNALSGADDAIAASEAFAERGGGHLIVHLLPPVPPGDWPACRDTTLIWAYTRHAALAFAPARLRVNALAACGAPAVPGLDVIPRTKAAAATAGDLAGAVLAMARWPSMTGQLIRLGG